MKVRILMAMALACCVGIASARNTITNVAQVTQSVDVTGNVDYVITGDTPFGSMGSVNIVDAEHAVVIIQKYKPSQVISKYMDNIFINGEKAVNNKNCQVRMYNRGAIIFPYSSTFKPLTCYTEEDYQGDSYNNYGMGNSGGYMNTLTAAQLNNKIRSFKLKRGYMVTFAVGTSGWGYSRCFIADQEDLEISSVPAPLNGKISSYRIFHWYNAHKAGGASSGDRSFNQAINASWCYDWAQGNSSLLPDVEWVPNHIYEDWPSSSACGSVTGSCHMKTNNEPGNSADDHPQSVEEILNNWENLMRTGMRLCSESSHDGSWNHLKQFISEIDARGWRCDLLDLHCYWGAGSFGDFSNYYRDYGGRPIWISEWQWGASWNSGNWNNGGIFAQAPDGADSFSTKNQQCMYDNTKPILDKLNASRYVERYAIWNGERDASKIYKSGTLSILGKYYATMNDGMGYDPSIQKVPNIVYKSPSALSGSYSSKTKMVELTWTDPNGDMLDSIIVERKAPGTTKFVKLTNVTPLDKNSKADPKYTFSTQETEVGISYYRITEYYDNGKKYITNDYSVTVAASNAIGLLQYGQLRMANTDVITTDIEPYDAVPYVVMGLLSNKNTANGITNQVQTIAKGSFKYRMYPWTLKTPVTINSAESVDYMVLPKDTVMHLSDDMMLITQTADKIKGDEVEIVFPEAFPEGVTPVVVAQQNTTISSYAPVTVKVYDITNTGFKVKLTRQEGITTAFNAQTVNYFACSPGQVAIGMGKLLTVGRNNTTPCGGSTFQSITILDAAGEALSLKNPFIIAASQTNNYEKASIFRQHRVETNAEGGVYSLAIRRQVDDTSTSTTTNSAKINGDYIGWFIISDDPEGTGKEEPIITGISQIITHKPLGFSVGTSNGVIHAQGAGLRAYNATGQEVQLGKKLPKGIYIVTDGKQSVKVRL